MPQTDLLTGLLYSAQKEAIFKNKFELTSLNNILFKNATLPLPLKKQQIWTAGKGILILLQGRIPLPFYHPFPSFSTIQPVKS